jgi:hypothetical protein
LLLLVAAVVLVRILTVQVMVAVVLEVIEVV